MMRRSNSRRPPESDGAGYRTGALDGLAAIAAPRRPGTCDSVLGLVADAMKAPITQAIDSSGLGSTIPRSGGEQDLTRATRERSVRHSAAAKMFRAVFTAEMRDFFLPTITSSLSHQEHHVFIFSMVPQIPEDFSSPRVGEETL